MAVFAIPGDMHRRTGGFIYESKLLQALRDLGHDVEHLQLPTSFPDPSSADIARTRALLSAVPADRPILLDGFIPGSVGPEGLAGISAPLIPVIHHPLGLETGLPTDRAARLIEAEGAALRHAAAIIVPSPHTAQAIVRRLGVDAARITVAPPGFDMTGGTRHPVVPPVILSVGLLAPRKGHDVLIGALAWIADLDWRARIVGAAHDPDLAACLTRRIAASGTDQRITLEGELTVAELQDAYAGATIFALATRYEGYGIVFGEAMKWGLPIISCHVGAVPDTVGAAGILVPPDDPTALACALRELLTDARQLKNLSTLSARAGAALPRWSDTAAVVARTVATASRSQF
ncbi:MAG: glycosyltransferase family 4 protein [Jannaschia sp.]